MDSRSITLVGIALILLGIVAFTYQGDSNTSREKVIDTGTRPAGGDAKKTVPLSSVVGGLVFVAGVLLVIVGARKSS